MISRIRAYFSTPNSYLFASAWMFLLMGVLLFFGYYIPTYEIINVFVGIRYILLILAFGCLLIGFIKRIRNKEDRFASVFFSVIVGIFLTIYSVQTYLYFNPKIEYANFRTSDPNEDIDYDKIYITYNPKCEYCEASAKNVAHAVTVYNGAYKGKTVQVVNVDETNEDKFSPLQKALYAKQEFYGSIVQFNHNGTINEVAYVAADAKTKNPVARPTKDIYNQLLKMGQRD